MWLGIFAVMFSCFGLGVLFEKYLNRRRYDKYLKTPLRLRR